MKCQARVNIVSNVEFEVDQELYEKYGNDYLEEKATESVDLDMARFDVEDLELSE